MDEYEAARTAIENEDVGSLFKVLRTSINDILTIRTPTSRQELFWFALRAENPRIRNIALKTDLGKELLEIFPILNSYSE